MVLKRIVNKSHSSYFFKMRLFFFYLWVIFKNRHCIKVREFAMKAKILIIVLVFIAAFLNAEEKRAKLAVMEVEDTSQKFDSAFIENATEMIRSKLAATGRFIVIDKSRQMEKLKVLIKEEKKESYKECYDKGCQIPLGQALSADTILRSSISCISQNCVLSAEIVDLAKEATVKGANADFIYNPDSPEAVLPAIADVVKKLSEEPKPVKTMLPEAAPEKKQEPVKPEFEVKRTHPYLWYGLGMLVAGTGLFAAGIGCDVKAGDEYSEYRRLTSNEGISSWIASGKTREAYVSETQNRLDKGDSLAIARSVLYASGAAIALGGAWMMIYWKDITIEKVAISPTDGGMLLSLSIGY